MLLEDNKYVDMYYYDIRLMYHFNELSKIEKDILTKLIGMEFKRQKPVIYGNYTDLTRALGRPVSHSPNVRKAALDLCKKQIITIEHRLKDKPSYAVSFTLNDIWQYALADNGVFYAD